MTPTTLEEKAKRILELDEKFRDKGDDWKLREWGELLTAVSESAVELARAYLRLKSALENIKNYTGCDSNSTGDYPCCHCEVVDALKGEE